VSADERNEERERKRGGQREAGEIQCPPLAPSSFGVESGGFEFSFRGRRNSLTYACTSDDDRFLVSDPSDLGVIDTPRELLRFISRERELLAGDIGFQFAADRSLLRHERELSRAAPDLLSRSDRRETARCSDRTWREVVCSKTLRVSNTGFRILCRATRSPRREPKGE